MTMIGKTLGHYSIEALLGAGGMGVVYRACDSRLGRDVAIKMLSPTLGQDPEGLTRLKREAQVLAALNHPNIATIYGFEEFDDTQAIVMELVDGQTLAERLVDGPLDVQEAIAVFKQIADGVGAANEKGIVHRDLKPANVKLNSAGFVKVLDFGLAKEMPATDPTGFERTTSLVGDVSQPGMIVGSAAYMSPEQSRGRSVDKRADVWAFGCCLFECLSCKKAFHGETISDVLAEILKAEPDFESLPQEVPHEIRLLLKRCLEKELARRYRDLRDVAIRLEDAAECGERQIRTIAPDAAKSLDTLTVLPFSNLKNDPNEDYLADGIADEISSTLGKIHALTVRRTGSRIRDYRDKEKSYSDIARHLNVDALVDGSVIQLGESIKATATLFDADGTSRWSDTFTGTDFFELQRDVAVAISNELNIRVLPGEVKEMSANQGVNMEAYKAFREAMELFDENVYECPAPAHELIQKAAAIDPDYLDPLIWLGVFRWVPTAYGGTVETPREGFREARKFLERAKAINPTASNVLMYNGWIAMAGDWNWKEAVTSFRQAIESNPSETDAHKGLAVYLSYVEQRTVEALYWIHRALAVEDRIHMRKFEAHIRQWSGDYDGALQLHLEILNEHPNDWVHQMSASACLRNLGDIAKSVSAAQRAVDLSGGNPTAKASRAVVAAFDHDETTARQIVSELENLSQSIYVPSAAIAFGYAALGDFYASMETLQRGVDDCEGFMMVQIRSHDWMSIMADNDRYWQIIDTIGYPALPIEHQFYDCEQSARFGRPNENG